MNQVPQQSKLAVTSLALGVFGVFTFWMIPFWLGAAAVACGFFALNDIKTKGKVGVQQAKGGIISGFISIGLSLALGVIVFLAITAK